MDKIQSALETQLKNIEAKTSKSRDQLKEIVLKSGKVKHGEIVNFLKSELSLGHGDANTLTHFSNGTSSFAMTNAPSSNDVLDEIYSGKKERLRAIHEKLSKAIDAFGEYEISPKKGYVSLRRNKQFATLGPKSNEKFELGLNYKGEIFNVRFTALKPGGMCQYSSIVSDTAVIDQSFIAVIKMAFDQAG